jgi:hypothetical protein
MTSGGEQVQRTRFCEYPVGNLSVTFVWLDGICPTLSEKLETHQNDDQL